MKQFQFVLYKVSIIFFLSGVSCNNSSSPSVSPSPSSSVNDIVMATSSQVKATLSSQENTSYLTSGSPTATAQIPDTPNTPTSTSTASVSVQPSVSGSIAASSSVVFPSNGGSSSDGLDNYLHTLTPAQRTVVENFEKQRQEAVSKLETKAKENPSEASGADLEFMTTMSKLLTDSQNFGVKFDKFDTNVNYAVITKSNAVQTKKFDCVKDRLCKFPKEVNSKTTSASSNAIAVPLECPIEIIKDPAPSRKRRNVEMSVEINAADLPMVEIEPEAEEYSHIYRYIRNRREAAQNNNTVCLHQQGSGCLDARLNVTYRIRNRNWTSAYGNKNTPEFKAITKDIKSALEQKIQSHNSAWEFHLHSLELRPGSIVFSLYADTLSRTASDLTTYLQGISSFGSFNVSDTSPIVNQVTVVHGGWSDFPEWPETGNPPSQIICGDDFKVERTRTCNNPKPENGGKDCTGPNKEYKSCKLGGHSTNAGESISSPYWPSKNYPSNAQGMWILEAPFNHTVELTIKEFQLEKDKKCFYDYLQIFDGNTTSAPELLPRTCGTAGANRTIKSTDGFMLVLFHSDRSVTFKGFTATWRVNVKPYIPPKPVQYKEQNVTVSNVISCPMFNDTLVPLGRGTSCDSKSHGSDCYFESPVDIISCIIAVKTNRDDLPFHTSARINMTFKHIMYKDFFPSYYLREKMCATWNTTHSKGNVRRSWSKQGCTVKSTNISHTVCECDHTGMFAILSTEKVIHKKFSLLANTYAGIGVSFAIVIIAILHIVWKVDIHGGEVMRINMCVAIILMMMTFLIGANVEAEKHLCGFLAFLEYFSVVAQFLWLMLHGLRIHGKIKEVFASGMNIEIVYVGFGWGLPLLLSLIAIGIQIDIKNPNAVCWTAIAGGSMWGYGAPLLIIVMLNIAVLLACVAPTKERKTKYLYSSMMYRMLKDATLLALFGLTCITAYLTVEQKTFKTQYYLSVSVVLQAVAMIVFGREGRKDYVRRDNDKIGRDNDSEHTNELSFGKFDDETSSNASSRMANKDPLTPEKGVKLKSSKMQETDVDA